jgi:hypothetical protein
LVEKEILSIALHKLETSKSFTLDDKKNFNCAQRYRSYNRDPKVRIAEVVQEGRGNPFLLSIPDQIFQFFTDLNAPKRRPSGKFVACIVHQVAAPNL